jgi:hypothetical protein
MPLALPVPLFLEPFLEGDVAGIVVVLVATAALVLWLLDWDKRRRIRRLYR